MNCHSASYHPTKRIFSHNDEFFNEGNIALRAYWLERDAATEQDVSMIRAVADSLSTSFNERPIFCELPSCVERFGEPVAFPSLAAYESHYESLHRHTCSECHLPFPGARWLQLHLDELHDTLNQVRKDRGSKIHKCYVEICPKLFSTPKMRRLHLIDKHQYPKSFPFDIVITGTISIEERQQRRHHRSQPHTIHPQSMDEDGKIDEPHHSPATSATAWDMEMNALTTGISRIRMPSSISFGRNKKPVWNRALQRKQHQLLNTSQSNTETQQESHDMLMHETQTPPKLNRRERRLAESKARSAKMDFE